MRKIKINLKKRKLPITLTLLRVLLAPIVMFIILYGRNNIAVLLFLLTALIAFFDSFIAKKKKISQIKSIIDLLADKFLINFSAIALYFTGIIPIWIVLIFLGRDLLTISGASILLYKDRKREFKPTFIGKIMLFFSNNCPHTSNPQYSRLGLNLDCNFINNYFCNRMDFQIRI